MEWYNNIYRNINKFKKLLRKMTEQRIKIKVIIEGIKTELEGLDI
jgi:hypothetical protein